MILVNLQSVQLIEEGVQSISSLIFEDAQVSGTDSQICYVHTQI